MSLSPSSLPSYSPFPLPSPSPSHSPSLSPTWMKNDDDDDNAEFGILFIILSAIVVAIIFAKAICIATRPQPDSLKGGDVVIWKEKQLQGEIMMFDVERAKFEVRLYTGRTEYLKAEQLCRPGEEGDEESGNVELPRHRKKGKSAKRSSDGGKLKRDGDRSLSRSRNHKSSADIYQNRDPSSSRSRSRSHSNFHEHKEGSKERKGGYFRKDGTWDPNDGTRHARHDRSHEFSKSHLHTILNAKDVHGELAEALGTSAAREKQKREVENEESSTNGGDARRLSVEKRRSAMVGSLSRSSLDLRAGSESRSRDRSIGSGSRSRDDKSLSRIGSEKSLSRIGSEKSLPRVSSNKSLPRVGSEASLSRVGSRFSEQGLHSESRGSMSRSRDESSMRDRSRSYIREGDVDDSAQMKRVSSHNSGLKQAAKSTSRSSNSVSRDRSTLSDRRGSRASQSSPNIFGDRSLSTLNEASFRGEDDDQEDAMRPDSKQEKMLAAILSNGEEEPEFLSEEYLEKVGIKIW